eukprot:1161647-Pelagomonas_calceolata.AAC.7
MVRCGRTVFFFKLSDIHDSSYMNSIILYQGYATVLYSRKHGTPKGEVPLYMENAMCHCRAH